ncbi:MAG TPA: helicase-associated domain-containing protein [Anaerolineae bacterium]
MRSLEQALQDHELIVLRVIGEWWDLDLTGTDKAGCVMALAEILPQLDLVDEMNYLLPAEAAAMAELVAAGGRIPVAAFSRDHGEVRLMGPGRLEREEPWLDPTSPAEALWYRGFLYRGFDETAEGVIEFYYLPEELLAQFPAATATKVVRETAAPALEAATPPQHVQAAVTDAVDDLTTLLALAQRTALQPDRLDRLNQLLLNPHPGRRSLLVNLAREMGMLREAEEGVRPTRNAISWLKSSREAQLRALADAWSGSSWNDLCHTPGLRCEGENWRNDPILARTALLDALPRSLDWFRLDALIAHLKETDPDFQRPDGNYDTWYIRDLITDNYISGFENWERVEGRLIRFLVQGPLTWLGMVETATVGNSDDTLYRLTPRALAWLADDDPAEEEVRVPLVVQADASLMVPYNADRYHRFQVARISEAAPIVAGKPFLYQLTPRSLADARQEGIAPDRILQFLEEASGRPVPASTKRALMRWGERGVEARLEATVVLRVRDASILETLRSNPKTRDLIDENLGALAAAVRPQNWQKLRQAAAQLGLLLDSDIENF